MRVPSWDYSFGKTLNLRLTHVELTWIELNSLGWEGSHHGYWAGFFVLRLFHALVHFEFIFEFDMLKLSVKYRIGMKLLQWNYFYKNWNDHLLRKKTKSIEILRQVFYRSTRLSWSLLDVPNIPLMPVLAHVYVFVFLVLFSLVIFPHHLPQLSDPELIQLELLLLFP